MGLGREQCNGRWQTLDSRNAPYSTRRLCERKAERCSFRLFAASQKSDKPFLQRATGLATLSRRGVQYYEYHGFRRELAKHENNWFFDWDTLGGAAKENFEASYDQSRPI